MDRGAVFWAVFEAADRLNVDLTVRAVHSRVIDLAPFSWTGYLRNDTTGREVFGLFLCR